jgi:non-homologous end joining protein Ku
LEAEANSNIKLKEFIRIKKSIRFISRALTIGAGEGGGKTQRLLADAMAKSGHVALAEMVWHDKQTLVLIRPCKDGLVLQMIYYGTRPGISNQICQR